MPLRTSAISEAERRDIDKQWDTERSYSLSNLAGTRRSGLKFVKALKTDEEWTRDARAGIDALNVKPKTSREIAEENARWYRELVSGSNSSTAPTRETSVDTTTNTESDQPVASTSRIKLDDVADDHDPVNQQAQTTIIQGEGSKGEPYTLEDDTEAEDDDESENAAVKILQSDGQPSNQVPRHQTTDQRPPDLQPDAELRAYDGHASSTADELDDKDAEDAEASEDQPQDMYCLLCKTLVPASDVPGHRTSILHQLSKSSAKDKAPLVPPTHYGVRSSNIGYGMLQRLGWVEDTGLGSSTLGRKTPLKASDKHDRKGLGIDSKKRHQEEQLEKEGKVVKKSKVQMQQSQAAAKPLAKNRKELERSKKREMQMFKEGLAYLNT